MTAFEYLSVLLSVVVGLAIAQVLHGYRGLLLARGSVSWHAPAMIWSAVVLLIATQSWWASFALDDRRQWDFAAFLILLVQMALLYMMAAVVLPETPDGAPIDLAAHFEAQRRPFFLFGIALMVVSVAKEFLLEGRLPETANLIFHLVFVCAAAAGLAFKQPRAQLAIASIFAGLLVVYIASLFARL